MTALRPVDLVRVLLPPALVGAVALGVFARGASPYGTGGMPSVTVGGRTVPEGCLRCHGDVVGLGGAHDPAAIGCSSCHLGDPSALDEASAHEGMHVVAGNLSIAPSTCGRRGCHPSEAARVDRSIMAGAPGLLAVNRFAFGERDTPRSRPEDDLRRLDPAGEPKSPAESHVRKLCASCHLGLPKTEVGDHGFAARGGGCVACHLSAPAPGSDAKTGRLHPDVSADVAEKRCEGCHSRSGRIALSFHGEVELEPQDPRVQDRLPDGRPLGRAPADVHADSGFSCFDCHTERGLMGDGRVVGHAYEAVDVRCEDCHEPGDAPAAPPDAERVAEVLRDSWVRRGGPRVTGEPFRTQRGTPLWRTDRATMRQWLHETGEAVEVVPATEAAYHKLAGHERLSCQACHASWAPRCTSCHTRFEPNESQFDHISQRETEGAWHERAGGNGFGPPLLAVGPEGRIYPFVEGMTMTIEGLDEPLLRTLWAPLDPHTTGKSRACADCHRLRDLTAVYPAEGDATRVGARLLTDEERDRIARVGGCVGCHDAYEDLVYEDFSRSLRRLQARSRAAAGDAVRECTFGTADLTAPARP